MDKDIFYVTREKVETVFMFQQFSRVGAHCALLDNTEVLYEQATKMPNFKIQLQKDLHKKD